MRLLIHAEIEVDQPGPQVILPMEQWTVLIV